MRLSSSQCHFRQYPLEIHVGSASAERTGLVGGGLVCPKGANCMATSELVSRNDLVGIGRAISILFGINGVGNQQSHHVGPPFPEFKTHISATAGWHFSRDLTRLLLVGGCGQSHVSVWLKLPLGAVLSLSQIRCKQVSRHMVRKNKHVLMLGLNK